MSLQSHSVEIRDETDVVAVGDPIAKTVALYGLDASGQVEASIVIPVGVVQEVLGELRDATRNADEDVWLSLT